MITVSDTTAITTLLKVDRIDVLAQLFGRVLIPSAVERELKQHHGFIPGCCEPHQVTPSEQLNHLLAQADPGEAEAICLAVEKKANTLLIDDKKGRLAEAEGLRCLGLPALVLAAKQQRLIISAADFLNLLEQRGNFCVSSRARLQIIEMTGESTGPTTPST